jgi:Protein of unknown function (DUF2838)
MSNRNRRDESPHMPSAPIQSLLETVDSDVLLLYDCCRAATTPTSDKNQGGVTEVIAACGYEDTAAEVDEHSFTNALIETLTNLSYQELFSVAWLHSQILMKLKSGTPGVKTLTNGDRVSDCQRRKTPVYSLLSETIPRRSIVLGPLPSSASLPASGRGSRKRTLVEPITSHMNGNEIPTKKRQRCSDGGGFPQIVVAIRVDKAPLSEREWVEWMRNAPANGRGIHVEGRWESFSTLLLLRMPVHVWDLLPENPAYSFVGFVISENLAVQAPCDRNKILYEDPAMDPLDPGDREAPFPLYRWSVLDLYRRLVIRDIVHWLARGWNSKETITLREKIVFICGVFNILLSGYILGGYPEYFHYWYTGQLLYLLPIRCYTFHKRGFDFFLADLCYVVNILCMCTIWVFPQSTRLFIGTYCLAFGNNAISITMWRSLLVFQSLDRITTVFVHVMPCVALHCLYVIQGNPSPI